VRSTRLPARVTPIPEEINGDIIKAEVPMGKLVMLPANQSPYACEKFPGTERFCDVVIGAELERQHLLRLVGNCRESKNGQRRRFFFDFAANIAPGEPR